MKTLNFNEQQFQAECIVKTPDSIIGYTNNQEVFSLRGISDLSGFSLAEGEEWDEMPKTAEELLQEQLVELGQQNTDLELANIELGQQNTDLELRILALEAK